MLGGFGNFEGAPLFLIGKCSLYRFLTRTGIIRMFFISGQSCKWFRSWSRMDHYFLGLNRCSTYILVSWWTILIGQNFLISSRNAEALKLLKQKIYGFARELQLSIFRCILRWFVFRCSVWFSRSRAFWCFPPIFPGYSNLSFSFSFVSFTKNGTYQADRTQVHWRKGSS